MFIAREDGNSAVEKRKNLITGKIFGPYSVLLSSDEYFHTSETKHLDASNFSLAMIDSFVHVITHHFTHKNNSSDIRR